MLSELMSERLNIDKHFIENISNKSNKYYRIYEINKRDGGKRLIYHPSPVLKTFQYWLVDNIFKHLPVSKYSTAYGKGCSIKKNALLHLNKKHILHSDIVDFFPSIKDNHIIELIKENETLINKIIGFSIQQNDIDLIIGLTLYEKHLTIGSVSAPIISNLIMYNIDNELGVIGDNYNCTYSRYADDMVFSSNEYIPADIVKHISEVLKVGGFMINNKKTYFMNSKNRKIVTGVIVNNKRLTVGRKKRDEIKKMVYLKCKFNFGDSNIIKGNLSFLKDIDPYYYNKIIIKYSKYGNIHEILKGDLVDSTQVFREVAATEEGDE